MCCLHEDQYKFARVRTFKAFQSATTQQTHSKSHFKRLCMLQPWAQGQSHPSQAVPLWSGYNERTVMPVLLKVSTTGGRLFNRRTKSLKTEENKQKKNCLGKKKKTLEGPS